MFLDDVNVLMIFGFDVLGFIMSEFWEWLYLYNKFLLLWFNNLLLGICWIFFIKVLFDNELDVLVKWWKYKDIVIIVIVMMVMKIINIKIMICLIVLYIFLKWYIWWFNWWLLFWFVIFNFLNYV